jgi:hypothetical protein
MQFNYQTYCTLNYCKRALVSKGAVFSDVKDFTCYLRFLLWKNDNVLQENMYFSSQNIRHLFASLTTQPSGLLVCFSNSAVCFSDRTIVWISTLVISLNNKVWQKGNEGREPVGMSLSRLCSHWKPHDTAYWDKWSFLRTQRSERMITMQHPAVS